MEKTKAIEKQDQLIRDLEDELARSKSEYPRNQSHQERLRDYERSLENRISHEMYKLSDLKD